VERERVTIAEWLATERTLDGDDSSVSVGGDASLERHADHLPVERIE
jgi:hypothetical protein